jgi:hypothetical protein
MIRPFVAVAALVALACSDAGRSSRETRSADIAAPADAELALGEEIRVDSLLRLGFTGVAADSRCPASVVCPWVGDGAVEIAYGIGMGPSYPDTLHTTLDPKEKVFGGYLIRLVDLLPYPAAPGPVPAFQYRVRLHVERVSR